MSRKSFRELFEEAQRHDAYWAEWSISDFTEELTRAMELRGLSRSAFARKLGVSAAYVTKILRGDVNFTLKSMTKLARVVDGVLRLHIAPMHSYTLWFDVLDDARNDVVFSTNQNAHISVPWKQTPFSATPMTEVPVAEAVLADLRVSGRA